MKPIPIARLKVFSPAALVAVHQSLAVASHLATRVDRYATIVEDEIPTREDMRDWPTVGELLDESYAIRDELRDEYSGADRLLYVRLERDGVV